MKVKNLTFKGTLEENANGGRLVYVRDEDTLEEHELNPRYDLRNHSPDGFMWGYGGSGPSQLALAILCEAIGDEHAKIHYQDFKHCCIAKLPQDQPFRLDIMQVLQYIPMQA